jgi:hypothetical protein
MHGDGTPMWVHDLFMLLTVLVVVAGIVIVARMLIRARAATYPVPAAAPAETPKAG